MKTDSLDETQRAAQAQFSRQSQRYAKGHILEDVADVREALAFVVLPQNARVLDVACGAGHTGLHLASLGHRVTCADISDAMLARTSEAAEKRGLTIETRQHPAEEFPYADGSFDLVTCRVAPHHFSAPGRFVREVSRVLSPGGYFLLIDGTVPDDDPASAEWLNRVEKLRDPSHVELYSPSRWRGWCEEAGLRVLECLLREKKQPDLQWYFDTAATSQPNREAVLDLVGSASDPVRAAYRLAIEEGRTVWWWRMLSLVARR
jgi:ubiquinone/menaquinone biosynthesis C-methylase UbiE